MIDDIDQLLKGWVSTVVGDAPVSLSLEEKADAGISVNLCLMDILSMPVYGQGRNLPLQVRLRYLISATAEKTEQAHKLLGKLLFSAMENPEYEVGLEAVDMEVWLAFGVSPRPAFYLSLPMRMERTDRAKLIRMPPELLYQNMRDLDGVLLGPGEIPLPNGRIELADIKLGVNSDSQGHFHFSAIPETPAKRQFFVSMKGREYEIETTLPKKGELLRLLVMEV